VFPRRDPKNPRPASLLANHHNLRRSPSVRVSSMADTVCKYCGGPLEAGFVATTNGSGLFWGHEAEATRLRPHGLEVIVPTQFGGTYSANLPAVRCASCKRIVITLAKA